MLLFIGTHDSTNVPVKNLVRSSSSSEIKLGGAKAASERDRTHRLDQASQQSNRQIDLQPFPDGGTFLVMLTPDLLRVLTEHWSKQQLRSNSV